MTSPIKFIKSLKKVEDNLCLHWHVQQCSLRDVDQGSTPPRTSAVSTLDTS